MAARSGSPAESAERNRPGSSGWRIARHGPQEAIEGYADRTSVLPGEEVRLYVSTLAERFRVTAYRVGWYGGSQARRVWRSRSVPGRRQQGRDFDARTRTVSTDWKPSLRVGTRGWPEGAYLLVLEADAGHRRYVPLVVRSTGAKGRTVLVHATATWQAYNRWGGYSLYNGKDGGYQDRSLAVSFDRPYDKNGAEKFMYYERPLVVLAERLGIPLAYTTGLDISADPGVLHSAANIVSLGHDEYWTPQQRRHLTAARDKGANLTFLGANTCFRRIRAEPSSLGPDRTVVCYKTDWHRDPAYPERPSLVTTDYRAAPRPDPESSLTGVLYEGYPTDAPFVVHQPDHWVFRGTGVRKGDRFAHLVGVEYDRVTPEEDTTPRPIEIVAHSPLVCNGRHSDADAAYYTVDSGAGVFATGTMRWVEALMAGTPEGGASHGMDARTRRFVTKATENLLRGFSTGPAEREHGAARDNVRQVYGGKALSGSAAALPGRVGA
ncbi:N,N-dimethylformamidase beta subunit family domain-containing protein [Streptomyces albus]|uniref:N,N-dimethylformamidase beta subunit family domain-containing protein n=1 Tax=Streptomyces albus TaxID=1888 RepID=UPI0036F5B7E8